MRYDLMSATMAEFVSFLFDHEPIGLSHRSAASRPWYLGAEIDFDPGAVVDHYADLFREPMLWLPSLSDAQIEEGLWAILGGNLRCGVNPLINEESVAYARREHCVRSMYYLFERFFSTRSVESFPYMWWDLLADDWECGNRRRENGVEDLSMQNAMFETIVKVLVLPSAACQKAALHGLSHLHHPDTAAVICRYLQREDILPELRRYARAAARFEVL